MTERNAKPNAKGTSRATKPRKSATKAKSPPKAGAKAKGSPEVERATGAASTLYNAQRQLGSALGVAVLGTVLTAVGTVTVDTAGTPVANLAAYRAAFLVASGLALVAAVIALSVRDSDAAATMRKVPGPAAEPVGELLQDAPRGV